MVSLRLVSDRCSNDAEEMTLIVSSHDKIYEEHHISKLVFTRPQVTCCEDAPVRGSRVVFASYGDSMGQVQKFAVCFSSPSESRAFMSSLKESLNGIRNGITNSNLKSQITEPANLPEVYPESQMQNCMPTSSFYEMLGGVEMMIEALEGSMAL